jgi:hypothetical protein
MVGKPENVANALEAEAENMSGESKAEYQEALPHIVGIVRQNFNKETDSPQLVSVSANGSGFTRSGEPVQRQCSVKVEHLWTRLV